MAPKRVDLGYTPAGLLEGVVRFDDLDGLLVVVSEDYVYDGAGRLISLSQSLEAGATRNYSWVYDAANRIISYSTPTDSGAYDYNDLDELTEVLRSSLADETYSYDASGNRTMAGYVTGIGNRVLSDGTYDYEYDAEGRRTLRTEEATGIREEYTWDQRNRLTGIETYSNTDTLLRQVAYTYDAFDRRLSKSVDANGDTVFESVLSFVYDGMGVVAVLDGAGSVTNRYLHGPGIDQVFADERLGGEVLWALSDNLGSVRDWVQRDDQTGVTSVAEHLEYDAYGNILSHTNGSGQAVANEAFFAFTGREWDADADLYFYRARWYDPGVGRFVSEDPLGFGAGDVNVQRYVGNHPNLATDPSGLAEKGSPYNILTADKLKTLSPLQRSRAELILLHIESLRQIDHHEQALKQLRIQRDAVLAQSERKYGSAMQRSRSGKWMPEDTLVMQLNSRIETELFSQASSHRVCRGAVDSKYEEWFDLYYEEQFPLDKCVGGSNQRARQNQREMLRLKLKKEFAVEESEDEKWRNAAIRYWTEALLLDVATAGLFHIAAITRRGATLVNKLPPSRIVDIDISKVRISQTLETNAEMRQIRNLRKSIETNGYRTDLPFDEQIQLFQHEGIDYLVNGHHRKVVLDQLGIRNVKGVFLTEAELASRYGVTPSELVKLSKEANRTGNKIRGY